MATDIVKVRTYIGDTSSTYFDDTEIGIFLEDADNDIFMASSYALRALAADASKLAIICNEGDHERDARSVARELARRANEYAEVANSAPAYGVAPANDAISTIHGVIGASVTLEDIL